MLVRKSDPKHGPRQDRRNPAFQFYSFFRTHNIDVGRAAPTGTLERKSLPESIQIYLRKPEKLRLPSLERGRSARGRASLTVNGRPLNSRPLRELIAALA